MQSTYWAVNTNSTLAVYPRAGGQGRVDLIKPVRYPPRFLFLLAVPRPDLSATLALPFVHRLSGQAVGCTQVVMVHGSQRKFPRMTVTYTPAGCNMYALATVASCNILTCLFSWRLTAMIWSPGKLRNLSRRQLHSAHCDSQGNVKRRNKHNALFHMPNLGWHKLLANIWDCVLV